MWTTHSNLVFIITLTVSVGSAMSGSDMKYVGCYDPSYSVTRNYHKHMAQFTLSRCLTLCRGLRSRYMGADVSDDYCFCGDDIPQGSVARPDALCHSSCPGEVVSTNDTCGGEWLISVYDLEPATASGLSKVGNARNISLLIGSVAGVRLYNFGTPGSFATITNFTSIWSIFNFHLLQNRIYVQYSNQLYRSTLEPKVEPGSATPIPVVFIGSCGSFTVNWVHDTIYWIDCFNSLKVSDLDGRGTTTLAKLPGGKRTFGPMEVDPVAGRLFWVSDGILEWSDLAGGDFRTNLTLPGVFVWSMTLDSPSSRLYYVGFTRDENVCLYELAYSPTTPLGTVKYPSLPIMRSVHGMAVLDGLMYWVNLDDSVNTIYRQTLNRTDQPEILGTIQTYAWQMRVVDPDLQRPSSSDPCYSLSCQHVCVHQGGVARCLCPDGQKLLPTDNTTCIEMDQSFRYVGCFSTEFISLQMWQMTNQTLEVCLSRCRSNHTRYAGIEIDEGYCHCSDDLSEVSPAIDDALCPLPCPGLPGYTCGGDWLMSVYELANPTTTGAELGLRLLIGVSNAAMMFNPESRKSKLTEVMPLSHTGSNVNYHFRKNLAFVSSNGILFRSSLLPNYKTAPVPVQLHRSCDVLAVDWEADVLYISDWSNNTILSTNLEGRNETIFLRRQEKFAIIRNMEVDPYYRLLIWTADGVLESCDLSGQNFRTNLSESEDVVRATTLHLATRTLYYITDIGLFSLQYDRPEASPQRLVSLDRMSSVYGLGVFQDHIYWMNYATSRNILYKAPLNVSRTEDVVVLKILEKAWHMKLVHPELQSRPASLEPSKDVELA